MDLWGFSHIVVVNIMQTRRTVKQRVARAKIADADEQRTFVDSLHEQMRDRVRRFNEWLCELGSRTPRIVPYVMTDPVLFGGGIADEVSGWIDRGAKGLKMHPHICGHYPDDPRMHAIYEICQDRGVPIIADTRGESDDEGNCFGAPIAWDPVLAKFPRLRLVMAHLPGGRLDERIEMAARYSDNLWFDLAKGFIDETHGFYHHRQLTANEAPRLMRKIGIERIFCGSDGPGGNVELIDIPSQVMQLPLSDDEKERILFGNARTFFNLQ
jgi:predicted TIM-barrel fold metal-dependent hydrolase